MVWSPEIEMLDRYWIFHPAKMGKNKMHVIPYLNLGHNWNKLNLPIKWWDEYLQPQKKVKVL